MSLALDERQRAMLAEMGVRVWQPDALLPTLPEEDAATLAQNAPERIAVYAHQPCAEALFHLISDLPQIRNTFNGSGLVLAAARSSPDSIAGRSKRRLKR